ncbi:hypothetical protein [Geothrix sp. PMB-07]|uniref:hypothetical protein n=1 Tax=Geothrix sp. PMB-07 TaxID=3068640 RepID=UPI0027413CE9|nr:hypothetical protein [Geothrix sp. PMB-07]WLT32320.1 hypothetical protein Q9293_03100 [Geothrix sp. PMB-07]
MQSPAASLASLSFIPEVIVAVIQAVIAYKLMKVAKYAQRFITKDYTVKQPIIETSGYVVVGDKYRVRLFLFNMRTDPIKIESLSVARTNRRSSSEMDLESICIEHESFPYEPVTGILWNPKGDFSDDDEHTFNEDCRCLRFKDTCEILVTIPEFSKDIEYVFTIRTNIGGVSKISTVSNYRTHFATGGERRFNFPKEISS